MIIVLFYLPCVNTDIETYCRERESVFPEDESADEYYTEDDSAELEDMDNYLIVDAKNGSVIVLVCAFCKEEVNLSAPMNWYFQDSEQSTEPRELALTMNNNLTQNRVRQTMEYNLVFNPFRDNDTGIYRCYGLPNSTPDNRFSYRLESVFSPVKNVIEGDAIVYQNYTNHHYSNVTSVFLKSNDTELNSIREEGIKLELGTDWAPWSRCECTDKDKKKGLRKRQGFCRINSQIGEDFVDSNTPLLKYFRNSPSIPCSSKLLYLKFPVVSNLTRKISPFTQTKDCRNCKKKKKKKLFKYKKTFMVNAGASLNISCPQSNQDTIVVWRKGDKILEKGEGYSFRKEDPQPRVFADLWYTLYIKGVSNFEAGNYTCYADDFAMLQAKVTVAQETIFMTKIFLYHLYALTAGMVLVTIFFLFLSVQTCRNPQRFKIQTFEQIPGNDSDDEDLMDDET